LANLPLVRIGEDAHRNPLMQNEKRKNLTILIVDVNQRVVVSVHQLLFATGLDLIGVAGWGKFPELRR
ncbi:hypothetical protein AB9D79_25360, partial [Escherichia coli]